MKLNEQKHTTTDDMLYLGNDDKKSNYIHKYIMSD